MTRLHRFRPPVVVALIIGALLTLSGLSGATAQDRIPVRFEPGRSGATLNGAVVGNAYVDYVLGIGAGQRLNVTLTVTGSNGNGSAYFNILPAGKDYDALFVGSNQGQTASVTVPHKGDWAIRVYLMGNDRDTGKTVGFTLDVAIPPKGAGGGGGSSSSSAVPLPEEDFFVVRLSTASGRLNVRNAPRASAQKLGEYRNGTVLRNMGGCVMSDGQQWCDVRPAQGSGVRGWVSARFLTLPGPGGGGTAAAPSTPSTPPTGGGTPALKQVKGVPAGDVLNVRSGPGTQNRIVGALGNGDRVRQIQCRHAGNATWCEIEMLTDMRERGWVNQRYLTAASAGGGAATAPNPFRDMVGPCRRQAARQTGVARSDVKILDRIETGGGPILVLRAAGAKYTCRREDDGSVTVFSEFAN